MMDEPEIPRISPDVQAAFAPIMKALAAARPKLAEIENVVTTRPGYKYPEGGAPVPAVVVAVIPGTTPVQADALEKEFGVPFTVIDATVEEQMAVAQIANGLVRTRPPARWHRRSRHCSAATRRLSSLPPKTGSYQEPEPPRLMPVSEEMELTICVSPEAGWGELEAFLGDTTDTLTVAMYQFTAPHIFDAVENAVTPAGRTLELILHPVPEKPAKSGVKANDLDEEDEVIEPLEKAMKKRFEQTWATLVSKANPDGLFASAYHIKVAVRDSSAVWLSSGNWQSSNQPNVHPFGNNPASCRRNSRRSIIATTTRSSPTRSSLDIFEFYIKRDFEEFRRPGRSGGELRAAGSVRPGGGGSARGAGGVRAAAPVRAAAAQPRGQRSAAAHPRQLRRARPKADPVGAEERLVPEPVYQFPRHLGRLPRIRLLVGALKEKIETKLDVRIICRDMMKQESLDVLIALTPFLLSMLLLAV